MHFEQLQNWLSFAEHLLVLIVKDLSKLAWAGFERTFSKDLAFSFEAMAFDKAVVDYYIPRLVVLDKKRKVMSMVKERLENWMIDRRKALQAWEICANIHSSMAFSSKHSLLQTAILYKFNYS